MYRSLDNFNELSPVAEPSSLNMDRKRRLTSTANDDATPPRRPSALSRSSHSSTRTISQQDRPLPMLPASDSRTTDLSSDVPGSSRENAIDLTSSPSSGDSLSGHSDRDLPSIPPRHRQSLMELTLPRWQPDSEVTHCPICKTQFSFWYRKHHCRKCGRVVCSACSPHRITIPRQYIVRPPEAPAQSNIEISSPNRLEFSSSSTDSTASDTYNNTSGLLPSRFPGSVSVNPALGGGEEVRLCNPCVPDPNPDPPRDYHVVRADLNRETGQDWDSSMPSLPISQRIHQARHSLSSAQAFRIRRDQNAAGHNPHNREQALNDFLGRRIPSSFSASMDPRSQHSTSHDVSSLNLNHPANQPTTRAQSYSFSSSRPRAETHTGSVLPEFPGNRSRRVQSTAEAERSRFPRPSQPEFVIDEADLCPVCSRLFPPRQGNANDEEREAHIRGCIARISGSSPGLSSSQSQHPLRMLSFIATEKDCLSEDGTPQECTICMEEYEVGDKLARLECLCKFHKSCIVGWFERKKECPVHKFS